MLRIGKKRQLSEEDVWLLGYAFQHTRLHQLFRKLRGSVVRRLLRANGIDIFIICSSSMADTVVG